MTFANYYPAWNDTRKLSSVRNLAAFAYCPFKERSLSLPDKGDMHALCAILHFISAAGSGTRGGAFLLPRLRTLLPALPLGQMFPGARAAQLKHLPVPQPLQPQLKWRAAVHQHTGWLLRAWDPRNREAQREEGARCWRHSHFKLLRVAALVPATRISQAGHAYSWRWHSTCAPLPR